uniref:JAZF zinc finger 1a n=1 Tax=Gasterosteus aculeatus TaxID=69293 RepID=G3NW00_GASAC
LSLTGGVSRNSTATPPRHTSGNLTPPVTPPITPSSSFRSSTPTGTTVDLPRLAVGRSDETPKTRESNAAYFMVSSQCERSNAPYSDQCISSSPSPQNVNGIKYHAKNGHRTQIRVRKPFKCRCGKSYKTSQGLRHHTINFHPPVSTEILRKIQG